MEPRRVNGKNHWYHETQSTICPVDVRPLGYVPTLTGYTLHASWPNCCFPTRWR